MTATAIAVPRPWLIPDWVKWLVPGLLGLGAVFSVLTSNPFNVIVGPARAFPGCEGFACESKGGRLAGSVVCIVSNLNQFGAGTWHSCILGTTPRFVVFNVAGRIPSQEPSLLSQHSNMTVFGQTAPGEGVFIDNNLTFTSWRTLRIGDCTTHANDTHDLIFQHLRMGLVAGVDTQNFSGGRCLDHMRWCTPRYI